MHLVVASRDRPSFRAWTAASLQTGLFGDAPSRLANTWFPVRTSKANGKRDPCSGVDERKRKQHKFTMTSIFLKLPSACCTARHLDDRLHPRAQSCGLLARATPPPAPQTTRATKDAQLPPCCFFQNHFSAPRPPLLVAAISPASPLSSHPACRPGPYLPPANLGVGQPPVRRRHPRGCRPSHRPSSVTPPSFSYPSPSIGHPAVVGVPPARRRPPRGRRLPPRPLLATPRSLSRAPPAVGHPAAVGLPPGGRRPPLGLWRALYPPLPTPLVLVCPRPPLGRTAVVCLPPVYDQLTYAFRRRRCAYVLVETLSYVSRDAFPFLRMVGATLRLLLLWGPVLAAGSSALGRQRRPRSQVVHRPGLKGLDQYSVSCLESRAEQGTCSHRVIFRVVFGGGSEGKGQRATALVDIIPINRLVECGTGVRSIIAGTMPINT